MGLPLHVDHNCSYKTEKQETAWWMQDLLEVKQITDIIINKYFCCTPYSGHLTQYRVTGTTGNNAQKSHIHLGLPLLTGIYRRLPNSGDH